MSFPGLLCHSVTVTTPTGVGSTDRYNNLVSNETSVVESMRIEAVQSSEQIIDRDTRHQKFLVFAASTSTVTGLSRLTWGSRTLRVLGEPRPVYGYGTLHHLELDAEEFQGN